MVLFTVLVLAMANSITATTGRLPDSAEAGLTTGQFRISHMGPDGSTAYGAQNSAVAFNSAANEYLVVWSGDDNTAPLVDEEWEIFGQRVHAATGAVGPRFRISDMGPNANTAFGATWPGVAYDATEDEYLVVWQGRTMRNRPARTSSRSVSTAAPALKSARMTSG